MEKEASVYLLTQLFELNKWCITLYKHPACYFDTFLYGSILVARTIYITLHNYSAVSSSIFTPTLCVRSRGFIYYSFSLYSYTPSLLLLSHPLATTILLFFIGVPLDSTWKWYHTGLSFVWLISLSIMCSRFFMGIRNGGYLPFSWLNNTPLSLFCPFICCWAFELFLHLVCSSDAKINMGVRIAHQNPVLISFGYIPWSRIHMVVLFLIFEEAPHYFP